jgi:hypothetical protein
VERAYRDVIYARLTVSIAVGLQTDPQIDYRRVGERYDGDLIRLNS